MATSTRPRARADLESSDEDEASVEGVATKSRGGKAKPVRHSLHRTPSQALEGPLGGDATGPGAGAFPPHHSPGAGHGASDTVGKYAKAENPPTKKLSAKERAKAEDLATSPITAG